MKWLVIILLLGNVLAFGFLYNAELNARTRAATTQKDAKLPPGTPTLTLIAELADIPTLRAESDREEFTEDAPDPEVAASTEVNTEAVSADVCIRTGPFKQSSVFKSFREWLRPRTKLLTSEVETVQTRRFFWVYLEATNEDDARNNLADLKRKGVKDYMLVREGNLKNAISLGLFRSQDSVTRRLEEMSEQGYKPVVVPKFEKTDQYWINASLAEGFEDVESIETELVNDVKILEVSCDSVVAASL
ncbi:MAG: SPOR domain-containing protein [Gammaproteobacteria bacterium]